MLFFIADSNPMTMVKWHEAFGNVESYSKDLTKCNLLDRHYRFVHSQKWTLLCFLGPCDFIQYDLQSIWSQC